MKKYGLVALAAAFVLIAFMNRESITIALLKKTIKGNLETSLKEQLGDGLHVYICGAGSPMPDIKRSGPCTAIIVNDLVLVFDVGSGSSRNLSLGQIPQSQIGAVFLTHFHSDHIDGLGEIIMQRWAASSAKEPLEIYGPNGLGKVVDGFNQAYSHDDKYRMAHHGMITMPPGGRDAVSMTFEQPEKGVLRTVYELNGLTVSAFSVAHSPVEAAVGYRIDYQNRSVVISGDTVKSENIILHAKGSDLLIHEALSSEILGLITEQAEAAGRNNIAKITHDILDYHATPLEAAAVAQEAKVDFLLFNHIVPPLPLITMEEMFVKGVDGVFTGDYEISKDGTLVTLSLTTDEITIRELIW
ncbi:MBL fold metallo-hydrolase [Glaciecola petra]|uniref:MBL fold metallo-hydrolase n=1 Tax=Glaciecola petra TaxID=3075602 RepID=A0ABU2ZVR8_9ALTE|nr:MBL fold metallo-hydrolase [Aestuariibacter sp. P117]MDT0596481.1 MBL fold metallo-hydrolase [Aestuariibacter sp. P117]